MTLRNWTATLLFSAALLGVGCEGGFCHHKKECCPTAAAPPCGCRTAAAPPCGCNTTAALPPGAIPVQPGTAPAFGQ